MARVRARVAGPAHARAVSRRHRPRRRRRRGPGEPDRERAHAQPAPDPALNRPGRRSVLPCSARAATMVIWINGAFGVGKTTVARALHERWPDAVVFDPEQLGFVLRRIVPRGF